MNRITNRIGIIGITLGDAAGIGPEIVRAALESGKLDSDFEYRIVGEPLECRPGEPTAETASAAQRALETSVQLALDGDIDAIVTGPIHKPALVAGGYDYPGHTEMLAALTKSSVAMMLTSDKLRVVLATTHLALRDVAYAARGKPWRFRRRVRAVRRTRRPQPPPRPTRWASERF